MKRLVYILLTLLTGSSLLFLLSCGKETGTPVVYRATGAISPYTVTFRNETGNLITTTIPAASAQDKWTYQFTAEKGEIVYVSAHYGDIASGITLSILLDGKVYKENTSLYDTTTYLIVAGTIPY